MRNRGSGPRDAHSSADHIGLFQFRAPGGNDHDEGSGDANDEGANDHDEGSGNDHDQAGDDHHEGHDHHLDDDLDDDLDHDDHDRPVAFSHCTNSGRELISDTGS